MFDALILGLIQGITEFLPISSSAHLVIAEKLLKFEESGTPKAFAAAIHIGTFFAVLIYFRKELFNILKSFIKTSDKSLDNDRSLGIKLIIGTIPVVLVGYFIEKSETFQKYSTNIILIAVSLIVFSILLYFAEKFSFNKATKNEISNKDSLIIGFSQIIAAIFTGASRSGFTLTTSLFRNIDRKVAGKFILLLSLPVSLLPGIYSIFIKKEVVLNAEFFIASIAAFVSGYLAIYLLLESIKRVSLKWFCYYRVALGALLILLVSINKI